MKMSPQNFISHTKKPRQDSQERAARTGFQRQGHKDTIARKELPGEYSED
jgi:hypothetical protein